MKPLLFYQLLSMNSFFGIVTSPLLRYIKSLLFFSEKAAHRTLVLSPTKSRISLFFMFSECSFFFSQSAFCGPSTDPVCGAARLATSDESVQMAASDFLSLMALMYSLSSLCWCSCAQMLHFKRSQASRLRLFQAAFEEQLPSLLRGTMAMVDFCGPSPV